MKRRIVFILLLLACGAIVNIAVAWIHAVVVDAHEGARSKSGDYSDGVSGLWHFDRSDTLGSTSVNAMLYSAEYATDVPPLHVRDFIPYWVPDRSSFESFADVNDRGLARRFIAEGRGMPMSALWQEFEMVHRPSDGTHLNIEWIVHGGVQVDDGSLTPRSIPLRPIALGFAINTLLYALLLWLLIALPLAARRALCRKRRLCAKCASPIGTGPVCTECGEAVRCGGDT